jgi:hypothetical protein
MLRLCQLVALAALVTACQRADRNTVEKPSIYLPPVVTPVTPMDRHALLLAVAEAASAHATGTDDRGAQRALDGREQPQDDSVLARWSS